MRSQTASWLLSVALGLGAVPGGAVIPVVDVRAITQLLNQIRTAQQQLGALRDQLTQARQTYESLTGARGMQRLLAGTARNYLPSDWSGVLSAAGATRGAYSALAADVHSLIRANAKLSDAELAAMTSDQRQAIEAQRRASALLEALSHAALENASARFAALQELIDAIGQAQDPKAIAELQARIGAEQGMLVNEATKLETLYQAAQAEAAAVHEQVEEQAIASYGSMRDLPPMGLED